jgi:hypothetical protein
MCGLICREGLDDLGLGYAFLPAARGRGCARETAAAWLARGFDDLSLKRIVAIKKPRQRALTARAGRHRHGIRAPASLAGA